MNPFPKPHPDDPDYIFENAMFAALAEPPARHVLEVLRRSPGTAREVNWQVGGHMSSTLEWLDILEATKLISKNDEGGVYQLDGIGLGRLTDFVLRFAPSGNSLTA